MIRPESQKIASPASTESSGFPKAAVAVHNGCSEEDVEKVLLGWWRELLGLEQLGLDDDFFDLGGHSLIGAELFARIKNTYGLELGLSILFEARTVRELARYICEASCEPDTHSALVAIQPKGSRPPVFWLPGGYGTTTLPFKEVSLLLGPDQPVYGFEAEMPEPDEQLESVPERAARFIKEIRSVRPEGPYSLIGFCSGGYTAYEMARQLQAAGQKVAVLAIVDCYSEHHPNTRHGKLLYQVQRTAWRTKRVLARGPKGVAEWVARRTKSLLQAFPIHVRRVSARLTGASLPKLPSEVEDTFVKLRVIIDAYHQQLKSYPGKSVVFIGKDSYKFCGLSSSVDPRLVWCKLTTGGSEVRRIPGDHTDLLEAPMMYRFAEELKSCLERSYGSVS